MSNNKKRKRIPYVHPPGIENAQEGVYSSDQNMTPEERKRLEREKEETISIVEAIEETEEEKRDNEQIEEEKEEIRLEKEEREERWKEIQEERARWDNSPSEESVIMRALVNGDGDKFGF